MKGWGFEMNLKDQMNGVQHVGVPTNDIETTIKFYEALGFEIAFPVSYTHLTLPTNSLV